MRIIFTKDNDIASGSTGTESEGNAKICVVSNENDLMQRRWFDFDTFMKWVKSNKLKLSGTINVSEAGTHFSSKYGFVKAR